MSIKENSTKLILGTICEVETMNYWAQEGKNLLEYWFQPKKYKTIVKVCDWSQNERPSTKNEQGTVLQGNQA